MDRNTATGILLIVGIVLTWMLFFSPPVEEKQTSDQDKTEQLTKSDSEKKPKITSLIDSIPFGVSDSLWLSLPDSAKKSMMGNEKLKKYGDLVNVIEGKDEKIHIQTDKFDFYLNTKGGYISPLYLREYVTYDSTPQPIITEGPDNSLFLRMKLFNYDYGNGGYEETRNIYFTPQFAEKEIILKGDDSLKLVMRADLGQNRLIEFIYTLEGNTYNMDFEVRLSGMSKVIADNSYSLVWNGLVPKTEKALSLMQQKTAIYYHTAGGYNYLAHPSALDEMPAPGEKGPNVDWVAFHSQFFSHTLFTNPADPFRDVKLRHWDPVTTDPADPEFGKVVKYMSADLGIPYDGGTVESKKFSFFAGPLEYYTLRDMGRDMETQISLGWGPLKWINKWMVIPLFKWFEGFIGSYGLIIFLLALIIKILIYPMTYKTYISTAKMRVINQTPEIKSLEEKFKDDNTKLQQEKLVIYRQMGVNMFGGCLPMLLQYPFLISLFFFFPNSIELRQQGLWWAEDLSTYDSILDLGFNIPLYGDHVSLFTLLMTASILLFTVVNQRMQGTTQTGFMKWFPYFMPLLFLGFLNNYSAGLSFYYLISNLLSIAQTMITKWFIDDEKILLQMQEFAKQKKKAGGQKKSRLEKWAESQQKKQREIQRARSSSKGSGKNK